MQPATPDENTLGAVKTNTDSDDDDDDSEDEEVSDDEYRGQDGAQGSSNGDPPDRLARIRREKRLAMNRESARARRKRKKVLLESLEGQVQALNRQNQQLNVMNETLAQKVTTLEGELAVAQSTIAFLTRQPDRVGLSTGGTALNELMVPLSTAFSESTALPINANAHSGLTEESLRLLLRAQLTSGSNDTRLQGLLRHQLAQGQASQDYIRNRALSDPLLNASLRGRSVDASVRGMGGTFGIPLSLMGGALDQPARSGQNTDTRLDEARLLFGPVAPGFPDALSPNTAARSRSFLEELLKKTEESKF